MHIDGSTIEITRLTSELVASAAQALAGAPDPWSETQLQAELSCKTSLVFCAVVSKKVLGVCAFSVVCEEATLQNIAVLPEYRGKKIASDMINTAKKKLLEQDVKEIFLEVRCSNKAAIALYEKHGFIRMSLRKNIYEHPCEDGYLYNLKIRAC